MNRKNKSGFTVTEMIIVVGVLAFLAIIVVAGFFSFRKGTDLDNATQEFISIMRVARNNVLASENNSKYGVYINTGVSPNQYVLFKGNNYASKTTYSTYTLPGTISFSGVSLGGGSEVDFDRLTGAADQSGSVSLINSASSVTEIVYVASSGEVGLVQPASPSDANRVKDSRHIQFNYSRTINTATEIITLTFNGTQTQTIPISSNLVGGELSWQGTVSVNGTNQTIGINTHRLNDPDTLFSIRRDRRYNNVSLSVTISGDVSGTLAQYSADGSTTSYTSIYVSNFARQ